MVHCNSQSIYLLPRPSNECLSALHFHPVDNEEVVSGIITEKKIGGKHRLHRKASKGSVGNCIHSTVQGTARLVNTKVSGSIIMRSS
jgi:hypothetical protein